MTQADSVLSTPPTNTSAEPLYLPVEMTPEEIFRAIGKLRKDARDEIDRLIRFLDETDNHMEREEAVDDGPCDDNELDGPENEEDEESEPDEPSLGGSASSEWSNQEGWAWQPAVMSTRKGTDLEDEHDGAEPGDDDEPSLGWTTSGVLGEINDRELDNCDRESNEPLLTECV